MMGGLKKLKLFWLYAMNTMFMGVGLFFLGFGAWYKMQDLPSYAMVIATNTLSTRQTRTVLNTNQVVIIISGCLLLVTGLFGIIYLACLSRVRWVGNLYSVLLAVCAAFQMTLFVLAVVTHNEAESELEQTMTFEIQYEYGAHSTNWNTTGFDKAWNYVQASLECCGSYNYTSWNGSHYSIRSGDPVPWSCCVLNDPAGGYSSSNVANLTGCLDEAMGADTTNQFLNKQGCSAILREEIGYYGEIIGILVILLYVDKIIGILMMFCLNTDTGIV